MIAIPILLILFLFINKNEAIKKISLFSSILILLLINEHVSTLFKSVAFVLVILHFFIVEVFFVNVKGSVKKDFKTFNVRKEYLYALTVTLLLCMMLLFKVKYLNLEDKFLYHLELVDQRAFLISAFLIVMYIISIKLREVEDK